jgi:hypothetical protein
MGLGDFENLEAPQQNQKAASSRFTSGAASSPNGAAQVLPALCFRTNI